MAWPHRDDSWELSTSVFDGFGEALFRLVARSPSGAHIRGATGLIALLLIGLIFPASGCGFENHCTGTALEVRQVDVVDIHAPLTVAARLTGGGRPLSGVEVKLGLLLSGEDSAHAEALFHVNTDSSGRAAVTRSEGVAGLSVPNQRVTAYTAYFQPVSSLHGTAYCWSSASALITCRVGDGTAMCPRSGMSAAP